MDDLRSEIRAAFEKEQAAHPPATALRSQVTAAVATRPLRATNLQWVAAVVAILLGLAIVAGLMSSRLALRAPSPANPKADYGPPPAAVQLLYVQDPNHPSWLIGYDWAGHARATIKLSQSIGPNESVIMAPDGQQFEVRETSKLEVGVLLDRLGQPVTGATIAYVGNTAIWADDNRHLCGAIPDTTTGEWSLLTQALGQAPTEGFLIAKYPAADRSSIRVVACSFRTDMAIVVRTMRVGISDIWVMKLSDGSVLGYRSFAGGTLANVVASSDASYVALMLGPGHEGVPIFNTQILRVSDWTVMATPHVRTVWGFSGDDSLLLADEPQVDGNSLVTVVDWRSGSTLWHSEGTSTLRRFVAQPGGSAFALAFTTSGTWTPSNAAPFATILIVKGDGSVIKFPHLYEPTW